MTVEVVIALVGAVSAVIGGVVTEAVRWLLGRRNHAMNDATSITSSAMGLIDQLQEEITRLRKEHDDLLRLTEKQQNEIFNLRQSLEAEKQLRIWETAKLHERIVELEKLYGNKKQSQKEQEDI